MNKISIGGAASFVLAPFPEYRQKPAFDLAGTISRTAGKLAIRYALSGNLHSIDVAEQASTPLRLDHLWETTCFEFFLAAPARDEYWEFNLSPARHWNAYHFDGYRKGMREESLVSELPFRIERTDRRFSLSLELDISPLIPAKSPVSAGITAVLRTHEGKTGYWALTHKGSEPDFHRLDSFILQLEPSR
ncbi:MAG TPA: DOMON-like domain-containing protein [Candidatus Ozemobacteraceae bacterium]|nr:DOMON-like domain-containing protein [Candidatus Ozemobacteraceae bacterium]